MSAGVEKVAGVIELSETQPDVAPLGTTRLARVGGALKSSTDGAAYGTLGGSTSIGDAAILARAQTLLGTTVDTIYGTHFATADFYVLAAGLGGTVTGNVTGRAGVLTLASTAVANSQANLRKSPVGGNTTTDVDNLQTSRWYLRVRGAITSAVDAQAQLAWHMTNNSGNPHARFGLIGSLSTGFFSWETATNGGALTTGVTTVALDTAYHTFEIAGDGTNITFYIDGTQVGQTPVANIGTNPGYMYITVANGTTAANRTADLDSWYVCMVGN